MSAREVYTKASHLVDLWTSKAKLAASRPFNAEADVFDVSMDIIIAAAFGVDDDLSMVKHQLASLTSKTPSDLPLNADGSVAFTHIPSVPEIAAIEYLCDHIGELFKARFPRWSHLWKRLTNPALPKAVAEKDKFIYNEIDKAVARLRNGDSGMHSAMDHILQRDGRCPEGWSAACVSLPKSTRRSECVLSFRRGIGLTTAKLFGYIIAGHDTSSSALRCKYKDCFLSHTRYALTARFC